MAMTQFSRLLHAPLKRTIARSAGVAASVFGYPWVEALRAQRIGFGPIATDADCRWRGAGGLWQGELADAFLAITVRGKTAESVAPSFYGNLCHALAYAPVRPEDRPMINRLRQLGLAPGTALDWSRLDASVREGLVQGLADAAHLVGAEAANAQSQSASHRRWGRGGGSGHDYLGRAVAARLGAGVHPSVTPSLATPCEHSL